MVAGTVPPEDGAGITMVKSSGRTLVSSSGDIAEEDV